MNTRCIPLRRFLWLVLVAFLCTSCVNTVSPPRCRTSDDCPTTAPRCDTNTNLCKLRTEGNCLSNDDCDQGRVCDANESGLCFDQCSADADCSEGDFCDLQAQRCKCSARDCARRGGGGLYGCHPILALCGVRCTKTSQCDDGEVCLGPAENMQCIENADALKHTCSTDTECKAPTPTCDTTSVPRRCVHAAVSTCTNDSDCKTNRRLQTCHTGRCVECLANEDCFDPRQACSPSKACE